MARYVALLRGINVGGNRLIRMADLAAAVEAGGFGDVSTYIQSGNVLLSSSERSTAVLTARLEDLLTTAFAYEARVVVRSRAQLARIVAAAPADFAERPDDYRRDVWFLAKGIAPADLVRVVPTREGVDRLWAGPGVVYAERLAARASQTRLTKMMALPVYREMTIRNWRTTTTLLRLLDGG